MSIENPFLSRKFYQTRLLYVRSIFSILLWPKILQFDCASCLPCMLSFTHDSSFPVTTLSFSVVFYDVIFSVCRLFSVICEFRQHQLSFFRILYSFEVFSRTLGMRCCQPCLFLFKVRKMYRNL